MDTVFSLNTLNTNYNTGNTKSPPLPSHNGSSYCASITDGATVVQTEDVELFRIYPVQ